MALLTALVRWSIVPLGIVVLGMTLIPADVWQRPQVDAELRGFDPNFIYTAGNASLMSTGAILLPPSDKAHKDRPTAVVLATTPLDSFTVSLNADVDNASGGANPLKIGVWSPWTLAGYFVQFNAYDQSVWTYAVANGSAGSTLIGGDVMRSKQIGTYVPHHTAYITLSFDRSSVASVRITSDNGRAASDEIGRSALPMLFSSKRVSVSASAVSEDSSLRTVLGNYSLLLNHQRYSADKIDDARPRIATYLVLALGALLAAVATAPLVRHLRPVPAERITRFARALYKRCRSRSIVYTGLGIALYFVGNSALFGYASHPFDMGGERLWAYVARHYGGDQLYYLPNTVSVAQIWDGTPYVEAAFPYEPVLAYVSLWAGWTEGLVSSAGDAFTVGMLSLDVVIKATNVVFGLLDAALIMLIMRQFKTSARISLVAAALFLFNPAVWFSQSIWGQTHVISIFFVLVAILLAEREVPTGAWLFLGLSVLTRPQMLIFGLLLGIVFLRKFGWRRNLTSMSWAGVAVFAILAPFTLRTSPSLPVDVMVNVFRIQEGGGNETTLTTVSQGAYSIWPLVTYLVHGTSGLSRAFTPSSQTIAGSITYQLASQVVTIAGETIVCAVLLLRPKQQLRNGGYIPWVAVGVSAFLMLVTGLVATHFLLALPLLLLCRPWVSRRAYWFVVIAWTVTTFISMYGDMGVIVTAQEYPSFSQATNLVTRFVVDLHAWDRFITAGIVANICAVFVILVSANARRTNAAIATS